MQKMTIDQTKSTIGGALSGSFLTGISSIIDAISNFIGGITGLGFLFGGMEQGHSEGAFKFNKNLSFSWDDTHEKAQNLWEVDLNTYQNEIKNYNQIEEGAYDLT